MVDTPQTLLPEAHRQAAANQLFLYVPLVFRVESLHTNLFRLRQFMILLLPSMLSWTPDEM
jgi:hypothetical protein